eukprot:scaffold952_cov409-Prasinococcus_capsulatus_cf.AAC.45
MNPRSRALLPKENQEVPFRVHACQTLGKIPPPLHLRQRNGVRCPPIHPANTRRNASGLQ